MHNKSTSSFYLRAPLLAAALTASLTGACDTNSKTGANPASVQQQLKQNVPLLLSNLEDSGRFLSQSEPLRALSGSVDALGNLMGRAVDDAEPGPLPASLGDNLDELEPIEIDGNEVAEALIEEIFNDENYAGNGDYRIPADFICGSDGEDEAPGGGNAPEPVDAECQAMVDTINPRIHVEEAGDGLDFDFVVGDSRITPVSLELRSDRASIIADISEAKLAAEVFASASGEEIDLPQTMAGVIASTLQVNGPDDATLSFAIRSAVEVSGTFDGDDVSIRLGEADPMLSLRVDVPGEQVVAAIDVGRVELSFPDTLFSGSDDSSDLLSKRFEMDWKGLSSTFTLSADHPNGKLTNLGIGDGTSTLKLAGETFFSTALNANSGSTFDLDIAEVAGELPIVGITPEFDLELFVDLGPLAEEGDDDIPEFFAGETYNIQLGGSAPAIQVVGAPEDESLKVISGALQISSSAASGGITVGAGQCLASSELLDGEHGLLGYFEAADCP